MLGIPGKMDQVGCASTLDNCLASVHLQKVSLNKCAPMLIRQTAPNDYSVDASTCQFAKDITPKEAIRARQEYSHRNENRRSRDCGQLRTWSVGTATANLPPHAATEAFCSRTSAAMFQGRMTT